MKASRNPLVALLIVVICCVEAPAQMTFTRLVALPGGIFGSAADGISADGSVVVGESGSPSGSQAFRWARAGEMVGLGDLPGGIFKSDAVDVSADGSIIVGVGNENTSLSTGEAFRWTKAGGMVGLGFLPGGSLYSNAKAISDDGAVIAGGSRSASGLQAFRWTQGGGMVGLGDLPGEVLRVVAKMPPQTTEPSAETPKLALREPPPFR